MGKYLEMLRSDLRFEEGLQACMNCGVCTAICPAAEFYNYDPRIIVNKVQSADEDTIEELLRSETIWYCGQCMSCRTRCPRNNTAGYLIQALRKVSQTTGLFVHSEKGRQQLALKRVIGENITKYGYCIIPDSVKPDLHPEQGPVWEWIYENQEVVYDRMGANLNQSGTGALRKMDEETMNELKSIFEITGTEAFFDAIEKYSEEKAKEMGLAFDDTINCEYFKHIYAGNSDTHQ